MFYCIIKNALLFLVTNSVLAGETCNTDVTDPELALPCHIDLVCDKCLVTEDDQTCQIPLKGKS